MIDKEAKIEEAFSLIEHYLSLKDYPSVQTQLAKASVYLDYMTESEQLYYQLLSELVDFSDGSS